MLSSISKNNSGVLKNGPKKIPLAFFLKLSQIGSFRHLDISQPIQVQWWICLLAHVQEELLHLPEP
jgi:hypothetical protein